MARYYDCDEETVDDIKLAISEACTNAVKAADAAPVGVLARSENSKVEFRVVDRAGGFDEGGSSPEAASDDLVEGGIGLQIIRSLFPEAVVEANPEGGTVVRFAVGRTDR